MYSTIPFDRWVAEPGSASFQWNAKVSGAQLTRLQRMGAQIEVIVDGSELVKRRGRGELAIFVQLTDSGHRVYQSHGGIGLKNATEESAKSDVIYSQTALISPGDYRVDVVILDTHTGEHAALVRTLHAAPLRNDPLPGAARALPLVEFPPDVEPPDVWFQPLLRGKLNLPVETRHPVRVEVLANASPSTAGPRFRKPQLSTRILADLLPGLEVLSQIQLTSGELNLSVIDLTRRQVLFTQDHVDLRTQPLDWPKLRPTLLQADPNKIDVHELSESRRNPQFFIQEVRKRIRAEAALIVLSGPVQFESSADRHPIELEGKPAGRVFFIRFHPAPVVESGAQYPVGIGRRRGLTPPSGLLMQEAPDALAPLLKPLQPRIYDVYSPEQFRKALSEVMKEIGRL